MRFERVEVECYSGYKVNERPVALTFRGKRHRVSKILDRWYEGGKTSEDPTLDYFEIRTDTGEVLLLRYNSLFDAWCVCHSD
ncbi:hypothetical protein ACFL6C_05225 [Myxococcota bacterium]